MRRLAFLPLLLAALSAPRAARADVTSPSPIFMPVATPLVLPPLFGEPTGPGGLSPGLAFLPLRLSLLGSAFPLAGAGNDPFQCESREEASGNAQSGFPAQHQVYVALTSQLVVHGFSRLGCPLDSIAGGGITYSVPVAKDMWLVTSAGAYTQPNTLQGHARTKSEARLDLLMKTSTDRTLSVGVGRRGVKLTGTW